jgi:hypothetical protein
MSYELRIMSYECRATFLSMLSQLLIFTMKPQFLKLCGKITRYS